MSLLQGMHGRLKWGLLRTGEVKGEELILREGGRRHCWGTL